MNEFMTSALFSSIAHVIWFNCYMCDLVVQLITYLFLDVNATISNNSFLMKDAGGF